MKHDLTHVDSQDAFLFLAWLGRQDGSGGPAHCFVFGGRGCVVYVWCVFVCEEDFVRGGEKE